jgi:hypothetical protein
MTLPAQAFDRDPTPHFVKRCKERGIVKSNIKQLFNGMAWAVYNGRNDLCEHVKDDPETGTPFYRFRSLDGIVYAPMKPSREGYLVPVTIFNQQGWSSKGRAIRHKPRLARRHKYVRS